MGLCLAAVGGCSSTALEHCQNLISPDHEPIEVAPDNRRTLLESLGARDFPVDGSEGRDEAWFRGEETLAVCTYRRGFDTCDNKAAVMIFTRSREQWVPSDNFQISTCARP